MNSVSKKQILIVEDDISLCWLLKMILDDSYEVVALNNPLDAWCWLTEGNNPNLIITDLKMPVIDGFELVEDIRTSGLFMNIPIIVLTGSTDSDIQSKCDQWGINAYLPKPFKPQMLLETAERAIN